MKKRLVALTLAMSLALASIPCMTVSAADTSITLSGNRISASSSGVTVEGTVATITEAGTYNVSGTLNDGRIIVNAKGSEVKLVLNGVDITCSYGSPIYIFKAATAEISLTAGTENILTDGAVYTYDDNYSSASEQEPNACLYSKGDLIIGGTGKLKVNANHNNGITSKDTLTVRDAEIDVTAVGNGINGKDSFFSANVAYTVNAKGGDALRSTQENDPSLGWITLNNCTTDLTAANDGIQSETGIIISGGTHSIITGGGYTESIAEGESAKGIKAGTTLSLNAETIDVNSAEDAVHAGGDITIVDGLYSLAAGDDGIHSDTATVINGGTSLVYSLGKALDAVAGTTQSGGTVVAIADDSSIFNTTGGFVVNGGRFVGGSNRDTVLQPSGSSSQASFGVLYDTAVSGEFSVWDLSLEFPISLKYVLVSTDNASEATVITFGGSSITAVFDNGFTLHNHYNSTYITDDETMTFRGVKAQTPASALGMMVSRGSSDLKENAIVATGDAVTVDGKQYSVVIMGDVSGDGNVNSTDFMQIRRQFLMLYEMNELQMLAADLNSDGSINSTDFMQVRRYFLGLFDIYA